jgi:hypothetical protein
LGRTAPPADPRVRPMQSHPLPQGAPSPFRDPSIQTCARVADTAGIIVEAGLTTMLPRGRPATMPSKDRIPLKSQCGCGDGIAGRRTFIVAAIASLGDATSCIQAPSESLAGSHRLMGWQSLLPSTFLSPRIRARGAAADRASGEEGDRGRHFWETCRSGALRPRAHPRRIMCRLGGSHVQPDPITEVSGTNYRRALPLRDICTPHSPKRVGNPVAPFASLRQWQRNIEFQGIRMPPYYPKRRCASPRLPPMNAPEGLRPGPWPGDY